MKKNMKYAFILLSICAVCAFLLALTNSVTSPVIAKQDETSRLQALEAVSNGFAIGEQQMVEGNAFVTSVIPLSEGSNTMGYILQLKTAGYGGEMKVVASFKTSGEVMEAHLLSHSETPGLGKNAEKDGYMDKFKGTGTSNPVPTNKTMLDAVDAQAVSGASVTFSGIAKALAAGSAYVKSLGGSK